MLYESHPWEGFETTSRCSSDPVSHRLITRHPAIRFHTPLLHCEFRRAVCNCKLQVARTWAGAWAYVLVSLSTFFSLISDDCLLSHTPCLRAFYVFSLILRHILAAITTLDGASNAFWRGRSSSASGGLTLKVKAIQSSGTAVTLYQSARRNIKQGRFHLLDNPTSHCLRKWTGWLEANGYSETTFIVDVFRRLYVWLLQHVSAGSLASFLRDRVAGSSCCEGFHRIGWTWTDDGETKLTN